MGTFPLPQPKARNCTAGEIRAKGLPIIRCNWSCFLFWFLPADRRPSKVIAKAFRLIRTKPLHLADVRDDDDRERGLPAPTPRQRRSHGHAPERSCEAPRHRDDFHGRRRGRPRSTQRTRRSPGSWHPAQNCPCVRRCRDEVLHRQANGFDGTAVSEIIDSRLA